MSGNRIFLAITGVFAILVILGYVWGTRSHPTDPMAGCSGAMLPFVALCVTGIAWAAVSLITRGRDS